MTVVELKTQLHTLIEQEDSLEKLEAVQAVLNGEEREEMPTWQIEAIKRKIAQGEADIAAGRVYTREEVEANIKQRLRKTWR